MKRLGSLLLAVLLGALAVEARQVGQAVRMSPDGRLSYEEDAHGNRLPDFSTAGYGGGGVPLPVIPARVSVAPVPGDDGPRLQAALDYVAGLPAGPDGWRGAVQLLPGRYEIAGALRIGSGGVVLRGAGDGPEGTLLVATGHDRRPLIQVSGGLDCLPTGEAVPVTAAYVAVGTVELEVADPAAFTPGDRVRIVRPSPAEWIAELGMDTSPARTHYAWKAGQLDLLWERQVTAIRGNRLVLDAPLTTALEQRLGGGTVEVVSWPGRLRQVGIEDLGCQSEVASNNPHDEEHAWMGVHLEGVEEAWVRNVTGHQFVSTLVYLGRGTRAVTVQDCRSLSPVSERGGYRRQAFHTSGQQTLFQRCFSEDGINDFTVGYLASGPNVFLDCRAEKSTGQSGSIGSWATGVLFDNVEIDGGSLALDNLEVEFGGVGWAAANSVLWQSSASRIICRSPPGALNWAIGVWGQFWGDGRWQQANEFVHPESLYRAQLAQRAGAEALGALEPVERANPADATVPRFAELGLVPQPAGSLDPPRWPMRLENGWLVGPDGLMTGSTRPVSWWRGHLLPARTVEHPAALTRFLPGRSGTGATHDLAGLAREMQAGHELMIRHHWGLWYDRRREDHQMVRRMDPTVWPPFYELPWARSGEGTAWDGLSRYDLSRFNPWYFQRLRDFAAEAAMTGRILVNETYFQHNILESGAHWVDFPWRPVNAIQETGFTEPPPFTGDTIKMAAEFYDVSHPLRRELHRAYIRQSLRNLAGQPNVIHTVGEEFTGPLSFVEFWLDVVAEWSRETGDDPLIALSVTKDVQDAILGDPLRADLIDIIELKYWWSSGEALFAPAGGQHLAPRQHLRLWKGGRPGPEDLAGMVREYRERYPGKAVIASGLPVEAPWAALAAGASCVNLPATTDPLVCRPGGRYELLSNHPADEGRQWGIGIPDTAYLIYAAAGHSPRVDLRASTGAFKVSPIDPLTGRLQEPAEILAGGQLAEVGRPASTPTLYWITR